MNPATLNVLGWVEDGEWVALALEMDLRGYGATYDEALSDLWNLVAAQISFARFKGEPGMIWRSAEEKYWEQYREFQKNEIFGLITNVPADPEHRSSGLAIPEAHVIDALQHFDAANG